MIVQALQLQSTGTVFYGGRGPAQLRAEWCHFEIQAPANIFSSLSYT
jgi:hypothetical protein